MAKKASNSQTAPSSSSSQARATSAATSNAATTERMVLRVKSSEKMKRLAEQCRESGEERRPKSAKTSKGSSKGSEKKKNNKKGDSKKPKKPPTAFFYFLEDFRKPYQAQNPDIKSMRDIGKACGAKWKTMTYEEKVHYYDIAAEKRREFDQAMASYMKRKGNGEDPESEDGTESESDN